ncbi:MAG: hypothetical protein A2Y57_03335, partial [Candidatus Woykebacteria bacterium RBG_13_40_7b]
MTFLALIFKNVWRHRVRTLLTIFGISIGIATIVVFSLISSGLYEAIGGMTSPGKTDFTVAKAGAADIIVSFIDSGQVEKIKNTAGVEEVAPYVLTIVSYGGNPYFLVGGVDADKLDLLAVKIIEGTTYSNNDEVIVGKIVAKNKNFEVGDEIELNQKVYKITGIFESGVAYQDGGAIATVEESQRIQGITDKVTMVSVKVSEGYNIREVAKKIEQADKELVAIVDVEDYDAVDKGRVLINNISLAISILAVVIGSIGVMNTIIMSVFERTREIGVLRAVGWKRRRVVFMILGESFLIGIFAAILGVIIGVGVIWGIANTEIGQAWLTIK